MDNHLNLAHQTPQFQEKRLTSFKIEEGKQTVIDRTHSENFVQIFRVGDSPLAINDIADKYSQRTNQNKEVITSTLREDYNSFIDQVADIFAETRKANNLEIHIFDAQEIAQNLLTQIRRDFPANKYPNGVAIINLDKVIALDRETSKEFKTSRLYMPGGVTKTDQIESPGANDINDQIAEIVESALVRNERGEIKAIRPLLLFEDDYFGGSTIGTIDRMISYYIQKKYPTLVGRLKINKIYAGLQVGDPVLNGLQTPVYSAVRYQGKQGEDLADGKVELLDFRDFLIGSSGLVVTDSILGTVRLPYLLPFVSPAARASIPEEKAAEFSNDILLKNIKFYAKQSEITLADVDPSFMKYMVNTSKERETQGVQLTQHSSMVQVCTWILHHQKQIAQHVQQQEKVYTLASSLKPKNLKISLDYNGTLSGDLADGEYRNDIEKLNHIIQTLRSKGVEIGINSDSSINTLAGVTQGLGELDFFLAENGNTLAVKKDGVWSGTSVFSFPENKKVQIISFIQEFGEMNGYELVGDEQGILAPELTGQKLEEKQFAFSKGRQNTIAIYCGKEGTGNLVDTLNEVFLKRGYSIDAGGVTTGDGYGYFCVQPRNLETNKNAATQFLSAATKHSPIIHIGDNPINDFVSGDGIKTYLVSNAKLRVLKMSGNDKGIAEKRLRESNVSTQPGIKGTIEHLEHILTEVS